MHTIHPFQASLLSLHPWRRLTRLVPLGVLLLAAVAPASAQTATGVITGQVRNAVTGQNLLNAQVTVQGTTLRTYTDESGIFRLPGVPAGTATLNIVYTGLDPQTLSLTVAANQVVEQPINLTSAALYGKASDVLQLDPFLVESKRETNNDSIAINEQRFSPNIKNVISTETLDDPYGGSMGDFLRFLPGVAAAAGTLETDGILIRGFPSHLTVVSLDGDQLASAHLEGERTFSTSQVTLNNVARVEVSKVPLPSTAADTMSGSINLVSKSAFERNQALFRYRLGVSSNEETFSLEKTPDEYNKRSYKIYPDFNFDYTLPINKKLGVVVTGLHTTAAFLTNTWYTDYRSTATVALGTAAAPLPQPPVTPSAANPYLWRNRNLQFSRSSERTSVSAKVDWRVSRHAVLSVGGILNLIEQTNPNQQFNPTVGTFSAPTITAAAGGIPLSYTPERVEGPTGRGSVAHSYSFFNTKGLTRTANMHYRFDDGTWRILSSYSISTSQIERRDDEDGFFNALGVTLRMPVRVTYTGIRDGRIGNFEVYDNANNPVDIWDINNYDLTAATYQPKYESRSLVGSGSVDARRAFHRLPFPAALQIGGVHRVRTNDHRRSGHGLYTYIGANGSRSAAPYLNDIYYGSIKSAQLPDKPAIPWVSPNRVYQAFKDNPALFSQSAAQQRTGAVTAISNSKYVEEKVSAAYVQGEARFFQNRLNVVTGVRFEKTDGHGEGPLTDLDAVFVRNADGTFARTPTNAKIRKPEAGAAGSLAEVPLIYHERAATADRTFHGYYPSLHLNFNATEKLVVRLAYAKTYGRPNYSDIIPQIELLQDFNDPDDDPGDDPGGLFGRITLSNPGLKPWTADNYDLSVEYYTDQGGVLSGGAYLKDVKDFFGRFDNRATVEQLASFGLDPAYAGWRVLTRFNSGAARVRGAEINFRQSLAPLGAWGRDFTIFANGTKLKLAGHSLADFTGFLPESASWGVTYARKRITLITKWNYRGEQKTGQSIDVAPDGFIYVHPRLQLDVSLDFKLTRQTSLYANLRNATSPLQISSAYGAETPEYARRQFNGNFGRVFTVGVKGSF